MKFEKLPCWTRKSDALDLIYTPMEIIKVLPAILMGEPKINEMTWRDYIGLAQSHADVRCGKLLKIIEW